VGFGSFGPPTDPAYVNFLDGLKKVTGDPKATSIWRWHPRDGKWYSYDPAKWVIEDLGLADTSPENALQQEWGFPNSTYRVQELFAPELFERLKKASAAYLGRFPRANLVWSPWGGGDWRNAFERGRDPHPPPGPHPPSTLPPECVKRVEEVKEWERRGFITHDQAQKQIDAIVAECT
jgi:hypothetical protein